MEKKWFEKEKINSKGKLKYLHKRPWNVNHLEPYPALYIYRLIAQQCCDTFNQFGWMTGYETYVFFIWSSKRRQKSNIALNDPPPSWKRLFMAKKSENFWIMLFAKFPWLFAEIDFPMLYKTIQYIQQE